MNWDGFEFIVDTRRDKILEMNPVPALPQSGWLTNLKLTCRARWYNFMNIGAETSRISQN